MKNFKLKIIFKNRIIIAKKSIKVIKINLNSITRQMIEDDNRKNVMEFTFLYQPRVNERSYRDDDLGPSTEVGDSSKHEGRVMQLHTEIDRRVHAENNVQEKTRHQRVLFSLQSAFFFFFFGYIFGVFFFFSGRNNCLFVVAFSCVLFAFALIGAGIFSLF